LKAGGLPGFPANVPSAARVLAGRPRCPCGSLPPPTTGPTPAGSGAGQTASDRVAAGFAEGGKEAFTVSVLPEDVALFVAAVHHMTHPARALNAQFARHSGMPSHPAKSGINEG